MPPISKFDSLDHAALARELSAAVTRGDEEAVRECCSEMRRRAEAPAGLPAELFDALLDAIRSPAGHATERAEWLLGVIDGMSWKDLPPERRRAYVELVTPLYARLGHWMACFQFTELLGDVRDSGWALQILAALRSTADPTARSMVPNGLDGIVQQARDRSVARQAFATLVEMRADPDPDVRGEVRESLRRVWNHLRGNRHDPLRGDFAELLREMRREARASPRS